jgi:hypothetical protein
MLQVVFWLIIPSAMRLFGRRQAGVGTFHSKNGHRYDAVAVIFSLVYVHFLFLYLFILVFIMSLVSYSVAFMQSVSSPFLGGWLGIVGAVVGAYYNLKHLD